MISTILGETVIHSIPEQFLVLETPWAWVSGPDIHTASSVQFSLDEWRQLDELRYSNHSASKKVSRNHSEKYKKIKLVNITLERIHSNSNTKLNKLKMLSIIWINMVSCISCLDSISPTRPTDHTRSICKSIA